MCGRGVPAEQNGAATKGACVPELLIPRAILVLAAGEEVARDA